ncbi:hypothetical protein DMC64_37130 [Amycolatopsis sp. WAC 04197]|uniref:WXG100-like domain-containing protein n=1 Tax=Amycolatopsis sp. WAC 04197 TaxID=2203199 RepID=UPI000F772A80|nr:hypothetical protein [Amycolatopsis sp. WAC 04197]RSN39695.1 hypothetical protein DMC64_37130 [Amycolatopsis sp. WAC 04197]
MAGGSVKLPAELQKFFLVTLGMSWPEGNDQALAALERAWREFEVAVREFEDAARTGGGGVGAALAGDTGDFFASWLGREVVSGAEALEKSAEGLAKMARTAAADVVKAKVMMIAMAALALATIIHLLATLVGAAFVGLAMLTARQALMAVWRSLVAKMQALGALKLNKELAVQVVRAAGRAAVPVVGFAAAGAGIMGGLDLSIQLGQIVADTRDELDGKSLVGSFVGGALGGAFAGLFHGGAVWVRGVAGRGAEKEAGGLLAEKLAVKGVTAESLAAAGDRLVVAKELFPGSVQALGHVGYGAGQVAVVFLSAPAVNAATGSPHASPWLGMLGAFSGFGGGRGGSGGGRLDTLLTDLGHLPGAPKLTIPELGGQLDTLLTDLGHLPGAPSPDYTTSTGKPADTGGDGTTGGDIKTGGEIKTGVEQREVVTAEPPPSYADTIAADQRAAAAEAPRTVTATAGQTFGALFTATPEDTSALTGSTPWATGNVAAEPGGTSTSLTDTVHTGLTGKETGLSEAGPHQSGPAPLTSPAESAEPTAPVPEGKPGTTTDSLIPVTQPQANPGETGRPAVTTAQASAAADGGKSAVDRYLNGGSEPAAGRDGRAAAPAPVAQPEAKAVDTSSAGPKPAENAPADSGAATSAPRTTESGAPSPEAAAISEQAAATSVTVATPADQAPAAAAQQAATRPAAAEAPVAERATATEKPVAQRATGGEPSLRTGKPDLVQTEVQSRAEPPASQSARPGPGTPNRPEARPGVETVAAQQSDAPARPAPTRAEPERKIAEPATSPARAAEVKTPVVTDSSVRAAGTGRADASRGQARDDTTADHALLIPFAYADEAAHTTAGAMSGETARPPLGRAEWAEWEQLRTDLTATPYMAERFEPYAKAERDDGKLGGRITQVRFTVRRGRLANGIWIREITVPLALVSDDVDQKTRENLIKSLQTELGELEAATDPKLLWLGNGDRAHLRLEAIAADGFAEGWDRYSGESLPVTVKDGTGETNQVEWFLGSGKGAMLHEIIHAAGGKDGYRDSSAGARRELVRGIMGESPETDRFIASETMAVLDQLSLAAGDHGGGLRNPDPARAGVTSVVSSEPYNAMHRPAEAPRKPKKDPDPPPTPTDRRGSSGSRPRSQGSDGTGRRGLWRRSNPSLSALTSPSMPTLLEHAEDRAGLARLTRPSIVGDPDFEAIRLAVLEKAPKYEQWVRENLTDATLKVFEETLDGLKWDVGRMTISVQVHAIEEARNPVDRTVETVASSEHLAKTVQTGEQIERTPVNPTSFSAPAGPVTVSGGLRGIGSASQSAAMAKRESISAFDLTEQRQVTRSKNEVTYRVKVFEKTHSRGGRERDPGTDVVLDLELDWPKSAPVEPLTPADGGPAKQRAIDFAAVRKRIKHVELKGTKRVFDAIVEQLDLKERRDKEVAALKTWLDNLGDDHGKDLVTGGMAKRTFEFTRREPLEILVRRQRQEPGSRPQSSHAGGSQSSLGHRRSVNASEGDDRSGSREWGGSIGSGFGESLTDLVGAKVTVNMSYGRTASESASQVTSLDRESTEQIHGAFEKHDEAFPFAVTIMPAAGDRPVSRGSGSAGPRRLSVRDDGVHELVVDGTVHVYLAEAGQMDSESSMAFDSGSDGQASSKAGMTAAEAPDRAAAHWKIAETDRKRVAGFVAAALAEAGEITDAQSQMFQDDIEVLLGESGQVRELVSGVRLTLPGEERSLFIDAQLERRRGHHNKEATWKELADKVTVGETLQVGSSRLREGILSVQVEAEAGPVTILGSATASREHERSWNIGQSVRSELGWAGGGKAVHLFNYPAVLNFRVGTDWAHIDKVLEFDDPAFGERMPGLEARLQIAVPARRGERLGTAVVNLKETEWLDATELDTSALNRGGRAVRSELDSLQALLDFPTTIIAELSKLLPESERTRDRLSGAMKYLTAGDKPTALGVHHEGEAGRDVSQQKIETWASHAARQARLPLSAKADVLSLDSFNEGGFVPIGSRDLHGTVELQTDLLAPQILRKDENHVFADTTQITTELAPDERKKLGAGLSGKVTVPAGGLATVGAEVKGELARSRIDDRSEHVVDESRRVITERAYLVAWDHRHRLTLSLLEARTGMFGGRHTGTLQSRSLEKYVPLAELRWVPASALSEIGKLAPEGLARLAVEDAKALESSGASAHPLPRGGPEEILGDLDPATSSVVPGLIKKLTSDLRSWEARIPDAKVAGEFKVLHDQMMESLSTHLTIGGFGDTLRAMLRGGAPRFGRQIGSSGKLEQLLVLKAVLVDGHEHPAGLDYHVESSTTMSTRHRSGTAWEQKYGLSAEGAPKLPVPEFTGSSKLGLDQAISPHAGVTGTHTSFRGPEEVTAVTVKFSWEGKATQRVYGIQVWAEVHPWARSGVYSRHIPGVRKETVRTIEKLSPGVLRSSVRSTLPSFLTDTWSPSPAVNGSLREQWQGQGRGAGWPDDVPVRGFPIEAPKLYEEIQKTVETQNAGRSFSVLVGTEAPLLGRRLSALLSEDGYRVEVGSKTIDSFKIKLDLGDRHVEREIEGATLTVGRDAATRAIVERSHEGTVSGGLLGGPISELLGELGAERQFGAPAEEVPIEVGGIPDGRGNGVYWVSATPDFTMIFTQANGREGKPVSTGPDGRIDLLVDREGLALLGLEPPAATRGGVSGPALTIPSIAVRTATGISRASTFASETTVKAGDARENDTEVHRAANKEKALAALRQDLAALAGGTIHQAPVRVETDQRFTRINATIDNVPGPIGTRALKVIREAKFAAENFPGRRLDLDGVPRRQTIQPLSQETFGRLLDDLAFQLELGNDPFHHSSSSLKGLGPHPDEALVTRLGRLSTANLPEADRRALLDSDVFNSLVANPEAMKEALYAAGELEPDRRDPAGAAVNSALRARIPLLPALLKVGIAGVTRFLNDDGRFDDRSLAPEREQQIVNAAKGVQKALHEAFDKITDLAANERQDPAKWHAISEQWAHAMQWFAALAGVGLTTPASRTDAYARYVGEGVLPPSDIPVTQGPASRVPLASRLSDTRELTAFWERLAAGPGHVLVGDEMAVFVQAKETGGRPIFVVTDPEGLPVESSLANFRDRAAEKGLAAPLSLFPAARIRGSLLTVPFPGGLWAGEPGSVPGMGAGRPGTFEVVLGEGGARPEVAQLAAALRDSGWNHADEIMLSGRTREDLESLSVGLGRDLGAVVRHEFERGKSRLVLSADGHLAVGGPAAGPARPRLQPVTEESPATVVITRTAVGGKADALAVPRNAVVAFVEPRYLRNITNAFGDRPRGQVIPLVVHYRDGRYALPDAGEFVRHDDSQFAAALAGLPAGLVAWGAVRRIRLYGCLLPPTAASSLTAALKAVPALKHLTVESAYVNERVHFVPDGEILHGDVRDLPEGTLTLATPGSGPSGWRPSADIVPVVVESPAPDPGFATARFGNDGIPPAGFLTWEPNGPAGTLLDTGRRHAIRTLDRSLGELDTLRGTSLPNELWLDVRDRISESREPLPESWVRAWVENRLPGGGNPYGLAEVTAVNSGHLVNSRQAEQAWGRARVLFQTRLNQFGSLSMFDSPRIAAMVEGFVDAAVQARPDALPRVRGAVFVAPGSLAGVAEVASLVESRIESRLAGYPPGVVTVTVDQLLARVSLSALTRPVTDGQIGEVQVYVEGQRRLSGPYGPEAYSDPDNPLPGRQADLATARAYLASLAPDDAVFTQAREVMGRHHQPPPVFVEQEPRHHLAYRERHRAATDLVAWTLTTFGRMRAARLAQDLVAAVGWPREGGVVGGAPRDADGTSPSVETGQLVALAPRLTDVQALEAFWERLADGPEQDVITVVGARVSVEAVLSDDRPVFVVVPEDSVTSGIELTPQEFSSWVTENDVLVPESLFAEPTTRFGVEGPPPAEVLNWRPPAEGASGAKTLNDFVRRHSILNEDRFVSFVDRNNGPSLPTELWREVQGFLDQDPTPLSWARAWAESMKSARTPEGQGYRPEAVATASGGLLTKWEVEQAWGHARVTYEGRIRDGVLERAHYVPMALMIEGFVDAAIQARPDALPQVHAALFVESDSVVGGREVRSLVEWIVKTRLVSYPEDARSVSLEQLMDRVSIAAIPRPAGDTQVGVVQLRVDGQRGLTGLYGPKAYSDPANPLPEHSADLARARALFAEEPGSRPLFSAARKILNRYHQPPKVFVDQERPRIHQAHWERYQAATYLVAWEMTKPAGHFGPAQRADSKAKALVDVVGWPREGGALGGAARADLVPAEDGSSRPAEGGQLVPLAARLTDPSALEAFWERLAATSGEVLTSGETLVSVEAERSGGRPVFALVELNDPEFSRVRLSPPEFLSWATENDVLAQESLFAVPEVPGIVLAVPFDGGVWVGPAVAGPEMVTGPVEPRPGVFRVVLAEDGELPVRDLATAVRGSAWNHVDGITLSGRSREELETISAELGRELDFPVRHEVGTGETSPAAAGRSRELSERDVPTVVWQASASVADAAVFTDEVMAVLAKPASTMSILAASSETAQGSATASTSVGMLEMLLAVPFSVKLSLTSALWGGRIHISSDGAVVSGGTLLPSPGILSSAPGAVLGEPAMPAGMIRWKPPRQGQAGPATLNERVAQHTIHDASRLGSFLDHSPQKPLLPELWRMIQDELALDAVPLSWARAWIGANDSVYARDTKMVELVGNGLNEEEIRSARGHARTTFERRVDSLGFLADAPRLRVVAMVEGFVDAAVQAAAADLPRVSGAVFVSPRSLTGVTSLLDLMDSTIKRRLGEYPPGVVTVTADQLLKQVSVTAITRPAGDEQIGVVQVRVDGQRALSGLYGPRAYSLPDNPLPDYREHLAEARTTLAGLSRDGEVFRVARQLMDRYHQPPGRPGEQPSSRLHQAYSERYEAATDLVAVALFDAVRHNAENPVKIAGLLAANLVAEVGWPRQSRASYDVPQLARVLTARFNEQEIAALPLPRNTGVAFVDPRFLGNVVKAFELHRDGTLPVVFHNRGGHLMLPDPSGKENFYGHGELGPALAALPERLASWKAVSGITIFTCDLTDGQFADIKAGIQRVPALAHLTVTAFRIGELAHFTPGGEIFSGEVHNLPEGTLTLGSAETMAAGKKAPQAAMDAIASIATGFREAVSAMARPARWQERLHVGADGRSLTPPDVLAFRPFLRGAGPGTLNEYVRYRSIVNQENFDDFIGNDRGWLSKIPNELWNLVRMELILDVNSTPHNWAGDWAQEMSQAERPRIGEPDFRPMRGTYTARDTAYLSGFALSEEGAVLALKRARVEYHTRFDYGRFFEGTDMHIAWMVEGFVDAAVQARAGALPLFRGEVVTTRWRGSAAAALRNLVRTTIEARLEEYPEGAVSITARELLRQVEISTITRPKGDEEVGTVRVRVAGQRGLSGLYGPSMYREPKDLMAGYESARAAARATLAALAGMPLADRAIERAREIMSWYHHRPRVFAGQEPRPHAAYRERYEVATQMVAAKWLDGGHPTGNARDEAAVAEARRLIPFTGRPLVARNPATTSGLFTVASPVGGRVAALAVGPDAGVAFVDPQFVANIVGAFESYARGKVLPLAAHYRQGKWMLPRPEGALVPHSAPQLARVPSGLPASLINWRVIDEIQLLACDLTQSAVTEVREALRNEPALANIAVTARRLDKRLHIFTGGEVRTAGQVGPFGHGELVLGTDLPSASGDPAPILIEVAGESEAIVPWYESRTGPSEALLSWRPPSPPERRAATWYDMVKQHNNGIVSFLSRNYAGGMPPELWSLVGEAMTTGVDWVRAWVEGMDTVKKPDGFTYRDQDLAPFTGVLNEWEVGQARGTARVNLKGRLEEDGSLAYEAKGMLNDMVDGFVDAAVQAAPDGLPRVRAAVFAVDQPSAGADKLRTHIEARAKLRLAQYPEDVVTVQVEQLLERVDVAVVTRPANDERIGTVRVRVDGQRELTGLYGPEAYSVVENPLPRHQDRVERVRAELDQWDREDAEVVEHFALAERIMKRYHRPPVPFADQEKPRLHQAHEERYRAALDMIAYQVSLPVPEPFRTRSAHTLARNLIEDVGWPMPSKFLGDPASSDTDIAPPPAPEPPLTL